MVTKLLVVRHCEAQGNLHRVFQGHRNGDVTENGQAQLELLSLRLRNTSIDAMYASPLVRAVKTAQAVNQYHHLPIGIVPGLIEINGGKWEGEPWASFPEKYPEESLMWNLSPHEFHAPEGEAMRQVYDRMKSAAQMLAERHAGGTVLVASHGCAIRNLLCWAKGWPIERLNEVEWCDNTALSVILMDAGGRPEVELENDASHLSPEVSTLGKQAWWKPENREKLRFD